MSSFLENLANNIKETAFELFQKAVKAPAKTSLGLVYKTADLIAKLVGHFEAWDTYNQATKDAALTELNLTLPLQTSLI